MGEVVFGLLALGVVGFWSQALGVRSGLGSGLGPGRCQFMACFRPSTGPRSRCWLSVGHDGLPCHVWRGPTSGVL